VPTTLPGFAANDFDRLLTEAGDGSIAFVTTRSGSEQLMLTRPGQAPLALPTGGATAFSWLALSPDGRRLAAAATTNGRSSIIVIDLATRQVRALRHGAALDNYPSWSADGRYLYWSTLRDQGSMLVRIALAEPARMQAVAREEFGITRFAADGRTIYYTLLGRPGIYARALTPDGRPQGPQTRVVDELAAGAFRAWALSGNTVLYKRTNASGLVELRRTDLASGRTDTVLTVDDDQTSLQPYASINGSILIERARYQNDLTGIDLE
jgi:Tol biopolymer transport system component